MTQEGTLLDGINDPRIHALGGPKDAGMCGVWGKRMSNVPGRVTCRECQIALKKMYGERLAEINIGQLLPEWFNEV